MIVVSIFLFLINRPNLDLKNYGRETKNVHEHEVPKVATEESSAETGEVTDRGMFDFLKKKNEGKKSEETINSAFEQKVQVSEPVPEVKHEEEEKKPSLLEKLHRNDSSSSSVSVILNIQNNIEYIYIYIYGIRCDLLMIYIT